MIRLSWAPINRNVPRRKRSGLPALIGLLAAGLLLPGAPASAQQADPITLDVRAGFDGYAQSNTWTPITITASNDGADVTGELRIEVATFTGAPTTFVRALDLPSGSRKQITLYTGEVNAFATPLEVKYHVGNRVVAEALADLDVIDPTTLLIGLWTDTPQALAALGAVEPSSGDTRIALLTADDLPDNAKAWAALDVLAIVNADTGPLTPEQRAALKSWIASGGRLIIGGGLNSQATLAGLGEVTPLAAPTTEDVDVTPLFALASQTPGQQVDVNVPASVGPITDDAFLYVGTSNAPLIISREIGYGRVDFFTPDLTLQPLMGWQGLSSVFAAVLADGDTRPGWAYGYSQQAESARNAIADVPGISLPSVIQLCGFLGLYVLLVGPLNYLVLRRLKRTELAWFTIPVLILVFSAIAYVTGFQLRGSRAILHRLAVVQTWPDAETAEVSGLLGVWSPRRARYDIEFTPGYLVRPVPRAATGALTSIAATTVEESVVSTLRGVQVDVASIQPYYVEGFSADAPRLEGDLSITATGDGLHVTGEVINYSDLQLDRASLVLGGTAVPIGDLPAGEVLPIDVVFSGGRATRQSGSGLDPFPFNPDYYYNNFFFEPFIETIAGGTCTEQAARRRCNLFASMLNTNSLGGSVYLLAWSDDFPFEVTVLNAGADTVDQTLVIAELPVTLAASGSQGRVELPPGLLSWQEILEDDPFAYSYATPYDLYLYPDEGFTFRFTPLSIAPPLDYTGFTLHIESYYDQGGDGFSPIVEARNRRTGGWDTLQVAYGDNLVSDPDYIDPSGGVILRVTGGPGDFQASLSRFDITLYGDPLVVTP